MSGKRQKFEKSEKTQLGKIPETIVKTFLRHCLINGRGNVQVVLFTDANSHHLQSTAYYSTELVFLCLCVVIH